MIRSAALDLPGTRQQLTIKGGVDAGHRGDQVTTRKERAEGTRRRLIDAAIENFSERHYDVVAVSDIAEAAGVAHGLLFHYFQNKRGIYLEAMREAARNLDVFKEVNPDLPPSEQIRQLFRAHLHYLTKHRGLALRLVLGGRGADPEAWELFEQDRWRSIRWVASIIGLDPESPAIQLTLRATVGAIDEATVYWLMREEPYDIETMIETFADLTIAGIRAATRLDQTLDVDSAVALLRGAPEETTRS
jgi:AcrR family transcriptional regulator